MLNCTFFVPACGLGSRVADLGPKPFLTLPNLQSSSHMEALKHVISQAPSTMPVEIALTARLGCIPLERDATVHFFHEQTRGQAHTIKKWMSVAKQREWVLISNCDNSIDKPTILKAIQAMRFTPNARGVVFTFTPSKKADARYSYCRVEPNRGSILEVVEKQPISPFACTGVYLLRWSNLWAALKEDDEYLSAALDRITGLYAIQVRHYRVWGDMDQIKEVLDNVKQYK